MLRTTAPLIGLLLYGFQAVAGQTASATAKVFFQAHTDKQWDAMAALVDSTSLQAVRANAEKLLASFSKALEPAVRARMDSMGAAPLGRALEGMQGLFGNASMLSYMFARVSDEATLRALSDRELMARWFEAKSTEYMSELGARMLKGLMDRPEVQEEMRSGLEKMRSLRLRWDVLGEIAESKNTSHVVYRLVDDVPGEAGVLTFRKSGDRWYIHFTDPNIQLGTMAGFAMRAAQARVVPK